MEQAGDEKCRGTGQRKEVPWNRLKMRNAVEQAKEKRCLGTGVEDELLREEDRLYSRLGSYNLFK